jgi:small subunit ribosomal protein S24e
MSFEIEILEEKKNPLIDRVELNVKINHFGNGTPNRMDIKKKIAALKSSDENLTIIKKIMTYFGSTEDIGIIYIYDNKNELELFEPFHIRVRNLPKEKRIEIYNLKRKKEPFKHLFNE